MAPAPESRRHDAAALFRAHGGFVANFLTRLGTPFRELDDLVQEVFLVAHRRGGFVDDGRAKATTWLAEISMRVASSARRKRRRMREDGDERGLDSRAAGNISPAQAAENQQALQRVQDALEMLDDERRAIFVLFELEGEPCAAIAEAFDIPVGTVYSRLHSARKQFKAAYARLNATPQPSAQPAHASGVMS